MSEKQPNPIIRVRPATRIQLDRIRHEAGWNVMEAADRAVQALDEKLGRPGGKHGRKRTGTASLA